MFAILKTATLGILCATLLISTTATASAITTTETWSFKTGQTALGSQQLTLLSNLGTEALISAWSSNASTATSTVTAAKKLTLDSIFGVQLWNNSDSGSPGHAVDNTNGFDFILLEFPNPTELTSLTNTWINHSAYDWVSVGAFNTNPFANGSVNWAQVAGSALVTASYQGTGVHTPYIFANNTSIVPTQNIANVSSQYWLIGAYNATFNGGNCGNVCFGDALKFGSITTKTTTTTPVTTQVPSPGTLSLFALALVGLTLSKRRQLKK